jgi:hypothetical protein
MSLLHPFTFGIDSYPTAYTRISQQFSDNNKENTLITFRLATYTSAAHFAAGMQPLRTTQHRVKLVDLPEASFSGLYTYIKTLPEWADAVDC